MKEERERERGRRVGGREEEEKRIITNIHYAYANESSDTDFNIST